MKDVESDGLALIASDVATLATCWRITRVDGQVFTFTDHDKDIPIGSESFEAASGFTKTAIATRSDFSVDDLEVTGLLDSLQISEPDIIGGLYDFATVEIFEVDYQRPELWQINYRKGKIGQITIRNGIFYAELRGLMQLLQHETGNVIQPSCRAEFGSQTSDGVPIIQACEFDLSSVTVNGTITSVEGRRFFSDTSRGEDDDFFNLGKITFVTGNNAGRSMEIKNFVQNGSASDPSGQIEIVQPLPNDVEVGDTYSMHPGCDKTPLTCRDTYNNLINYRGNPFVPGAKRALQVAEPLGTAGPDDIFGPDDN